MAIKFYKIRDPHGYMGNFWKARIFVYGKWFDTTEAAYMAQKTNVESEVLAIQNAVKPMDARNLGQKCFLRENWEHIKDIVMYNCVLAKFLQHKDLRDQLLATGDEELIEDSPVDWVWGCGTDGTGRNELGKILMRIRKELQGE
ncbi:MAG TPA: NADAR family protein [Candidatus Saccharimonadales bacterium]